jgi:type I restriction enzyme S subunit
MTNWKEYKLEDVATVQTGPFGSQLHQKDYVEIGTPIITVEHLGDNRITYQNLPKVTKEDKERLKKYHLQEGDVVFSRVGSVDRRALVTKKEDGWLFSGRCLRVRADEKLANGAFLSYYFGQENFKEYIRRIAVGATMPSINTKILSEIVVTLPDLPTQTAIAEILSSLDDKIELNNKINQELENLAQTLFKQWFIDFEFPNENGEPYKSSGGEMVDSELGEIPHGWKVSTIDDITEVVTKGTTPTTIGGKFTESGINFIKVESLTEQGAYIKSKFGFIDEDTNQLLKRSIIKEGDVLFSIAGTIGRVAVVTKDILPANTNQAIAIIRPNKVDSNFLKLLMQSALIQNDTKSNVVQAVQANLSLGVIKATKFIRPLSDILEVFQSATKEIFEQVNLLTEENQELTSLRDTLLPKLISGELEVAAVKV